MSYEKCSELVSYHKLLNEVIFDTNTGLLHTSNSRPTCDMNSIRIGETCEHARCICINTKFKNEGQAY